jgi:PAS domain S-box-containing protein
MTALIEHADCVLWEAEVDVGDKGWWEWRMTIHPSVFARKLFRGVLPAPDGDLWAQFHVAQRAEMDERARRAINAGETGYVQEFSATRDGHTFWLREDVSITATGPKRYWLVGLITDITARREAELAHRQSELTVDSILEHAQCLLWRATVVLENGVLKWPHFDIPHSQFSELLFGDRVFSPDRGFWENLNVPEQAEMDARSTNAVLAGASSYTQRFRAITKEGRVFWLHERVSITKVGANQWSLVGVATDATAQHEAEEARRRSEAKVSTLLELAECLVWEATVTVRDDSLHWDLYTQRSVLYRRIFGDRDETVLNWHTLVVPELPEMSARALAAVKNRASGYSQEFHVENPGEVIWLREVVTMVELPTGAFRLVGVITDITAQRRAEAAQNASEMRLRALLEQADCMIWQGEVRREAPGQFTWKIFTPNSQLYRRLFGREAEGDHHFPWDPAIIPEYPEMVARPRHAMAAGLPGYEQVFHCNFPDGPVWLNEKVSIKPAGPDRWEMIGIITDITAQRVSEIARQNSDARLRELLARADCLLWEATTTVLPNGQPHWEFHVHPSGLCETLYGAAQPKPEVGLWRSFDIPEREAMNTRCQTAMRERLPGYEQVFHIIRPDGSVIWISESVTIRQIDGDRYSLVGVAVDITPQRGAEEALAAEKERLSVTLRAMNESVITTDVGGVVQFMNPAAAALTGWSEVEACGRPVAEICRLESKRTNRDLVLPVAEVARGDVVADLPPDTRLVTRDARHRLIDGCCAPIHAVDSKVIGTVLVLRDVTEQDRLEQELVRATRLESVGVLAGGIAHDFNNILTAVMGNLTLAQLDVAPDGPAAGSLRSAEKAALRARDLTQQLLTFAKGGEPVRAAVQLEAVVREMTSFALHGSQVKASFDLAPDLWPADADKGQIGRVVQNLVINAVQAMPNGGTLRITARNDVLDGLSLPGLAPGSYIQIAITDTGEGIQMEHLARIFDPYFTTKQTGTGLGLAAVYSIVKKHHGHIDVESQVGQGTTFRIWLPALRGGVVGQESRAPSDPGRMNGRVLFMDDEQIIRDMASILLRRFGLSVDCAADGAEAIGKYQAALNRGERYDLVIMDLTIPGGMGGLAAVRQLHLIDPGVKAIVSSGYSSDPVLANYREHGFVGMVPKPYEVNELARVLREVLPGA